LDGKHTIFGRLVGGGTTLSAIEQVPVEEKTYIPLEPVTFLKAEVFVNPFEEAEAEVAKERAAALESKNPAPKASAPQYRSDGVHTSAFPRPQPHGSGIGKYIKPDLKVALKRIPDKELGDDHQPTKKPISRPYTFSDW